MKAWFKNLNHQYKLPQVTNDVYNLLMRDADNDINCQGYRKYGPPTKNENLQEIMTETYCYFATHYFKVIKSLISMEKNISVDSFYMDYVNLVDIGCNIGTATFAYIDLLIDYVSTNQIQDRFTVNIVFVECSQIRTTLLKKCIDRYINIIAQVGYNIVINYTICQSKFPDNLQIIKDNLITSCHCIVMMSNVVNWMGTDSEIAGGIHKINLEIDSYEDFKIVHIENTEMKDKIHNVFAQINNFGIYDLYGPIFDANLKFKNPMNSYFRDNRQFTYYKHKRGFYYGKVKPTEVINALSSDLLLRQAFEKASLYHEMDMITDEIELKYCRQNSSRIINTIKNNIKDGFKYSNRYLEYEMPKDKDKKRPLCIDFFADEIFSVALLLVIGVKIDLEQDDSISFGNRLMYNRYSPSVMKNYYHQYFNEYLDKAKSYIESNKYKNYVKLDLKSYYSHIKHTKVLNLIEAFMEENKKWLSNTHWIIDMLNSFLNRRYLGCTEGSGLPQGPSLSALLANMYLQDFDTWINSKGDGITSVRYVDDTMIFTNEGTVSLIKDVSDYLSSSNLNLELNVDKTESGKVKELRINNQDESYDALSSKSFEMLISIYSLDGTNYNKFRKDPQHFCKMLHLCLKNLNIYIPEEWLFRKLRKQSRNEYISNKANSVGYRINWGYIPRHSRNIKTWEHKFRRKNKEFIEDINNLINNVSNEFTEVYSRCKENQFGDKKAEVENRKKLKFLFNKLGTFTNKSLVNQDILSYLMDNPWLVNLKKLRAYNKVKKYILQELTTADINDTTFKVLISIWLIGEMKSTNSLETLKKRFLDSVTRNDTKGILLNTLITESLLKIDLWDSFDVSQITDVLDNLMRQNNAIYQIVRNCFMLLGMIERRVAVTYIDKGLATYSNHQHIVDYLQWLKTSIGDNVLLKFSEIDRTVTDEYPVIDYTNQDYLSL